MSTKRKKANAESTPVVAAAPAAEEVVDTKVETAAAEGVTDTVEHTDGDTAPAADAVSTEVVNDEAPAETAPDSTATDEAPVDPFRLGVEIVHAADEPSTASKFPRLMSLTEQAVNYVRRVLPKDYGLTEEETQAAIDSVERLHPTFVVTDADGKRSVAVVEELFSRPAVLSFIAEAQSARPALKVELVLNYRLRDLNFIGLPLGS